MGNLLFHGPLAPVRHDAHVLRRLGVPCVVRAQLYTISLWNCLSCTFASQGRADLACRWSCPGGGGQRGKNTVSKDGEANTELGASRCKHNTRIHTKLISFVTWILVTRKHFVRPTPFSERFLGPKNAAPMFKKCTLRDTPLSVEAFPFVHACVSNEQTCAGHKPALHFAWVPRNKRLPRNPSRSIVHRRSLD